MKILVVDDEKTLVKGIKFNLEMEGYTVDCAYDGEEAVALAKSDNYDLIILDLMMPKKDGLQACSEIRAFSSVPIIMLTARSTDSDTLMGFESGADDYITKPFNILLLKARVRALIRRSSMSSESTSAPKGFGDVVIDEESRRVKKCGEDITLTIKEYDLLLFLLKNAGKVYSRENLLNLVWGYDFIGDPRTVDVHIRRLREKLEDDSAHPKYILTKWGFGYYFND